MKMEHKDIYEEVTNLLEENNDFEINESLENSVYKEVIISGIRLIKKYGLKSAFEQQIVLHYISHHFMEDGTMSALQPTCIVLLLYKELRALIEPNGEHRIVELDEWALIFGELPGVSYAKKVKKLAEKNNNKIIRKG